MDEICFFITFIVSVMFKWNCNRRLLVWTQLGNWDGTYSSIKIIQIDKNFEVIIWPGRFCILSCHTNKQSRSPALVSFTYGVASLQLATPGAAALGVGSVVFLHGEDGGCLGNRWCSLVEGRGWHQSRGETLAGNIHRLRLLLQSAGHKQTTEAEHDVKFTRLKKLCQCVNAIVDTEWSGKCCVTFTVQRQANQSIFASGVVDVTEM